MSTETPPIFQVIRQDHEPSMDPTDQSTGTWTIYFRTRSGVESFISVPDAQYDPATIGPMIARKAQAIEAVHALGESEHGA